MLIILELQTLWIIAYSPCQEGTVGNQILNLSLRSQMLSHSDTQRGYQQSVKRTVWVANTVWIYCTRSYSETLGFIEAHCICNLLEMFVFLLWTSLCIGLVEAEVKENK